MKKASGFKMKNPSIAKLAKAAGSPMKADIKFDIVSKRQDPTKIGTKKSLTKPKKISFDEAYEKRDMKLYGGLNKADYIKEAKRQKAVKESKVLKKGGTYDVPKKPMVSKSGGAKTSVGTTVKKDVQKKNPTIKAPDTSKKTLTDPKKSKLAVDGKSKTKKKFKDTKVGKFLTRKRSKNNKKKTYNPRLNRFE